LASGFAGDHLVGLGKRKVLQNEDNNSVVSWIGIKQSFEEADEIIGCLEILCCRRPAISFVDGAITMYPFESSDQRDAVNRSAKEAVFDVALRFKSGNDGVRNLSDSGEASK
jgi:hypothetical protein